MEDRVRAEVLAAVGVMHADLCDQVRLRIAEMSLASDEHTAVFAVERRVIQHDECLARLFDAEREAHAHGVFELQAGQLMQQDVYVRLEPNVATFEKPGDRRPSYFIELTLRDGHVAAIRDFRHVPYIAREADFAH